MFASLHTASLATRRMQSGGSLHRFVQTIALAVIAQHQRRALADLDAGRLADIGVTRAEALRESRRRVWDVPANWLA